jgi:hypothetical protein
MAMRRWIGFLAVLLGACHAEQVGPAASPSNVQGSAEAAPSTPSKSAGQAPARTASDEAASTSSAPTDPREAELLALWNEYRRCLVARDGTSALAVLTPETFAEYERLRRLSLELTRAELVQADLMDRVVVLSVRARLTGAELRAMTGRELLRLSIDRGWVGSNLPNSVKLKRVEGRVAYVAFVENGEEMPFEIPMLRQSGSRWGVDLVELSRLVRPAMQQLLTRLAEQHGTDLNGALILIIERLIGQAPPESIWDPPT